MQLTAQNGVMDGVGVVLVSVFGKTVISLNPAHKTPNRQSIVIKLSYWASSVSHTVKCIGVGHSFITNQ